MSDAICVDVGSTFTKGLRVDLDSGAVLGSAARPTTVATDVLTGLYAVVADLGASAAAPLLVCSSAGGGLRLAVVGYEESVTALAGYRAGLSAGARVVHVNAGRLTGADVAALRAARPDVILLVGGTDGGNADVLRHNASRLANARVAMPVVLAGNADARIECVEILTRTRRTVVPADNVLPRIGEIAPESARAAIRSVFLTHVIGGKKLSRGPEFAGLVRRATPDAVLQGVEVLAAATGRDALVVDIGGATTDVYSALIPSGEDVEIVRDVSPTPRVARTVEADLGMRWSAGGVLDAAERERLPVTDDLRPYAESVANDIAHLPTSPAEWKCELELARLAAVIAVRRHARPVRPGQAPRALRDVGRVMGSGGVLRHADPAAAREILGALLTDHGGGWPVPDRAVAGVDTAYVLFAAGLLAQEHPRAAAALTCSLTH